MAAPKGYECATMKDFVGHDFGTSEPLDINQIRINTFADVTGDHQWIHTNPDMAKKHSPFGSTVAHGFLTLSILAAAIQATGVVPKDAKGVLNYGVENVRFLTPVPVDSKIISSFKLSSVEEKGEGRLLVRVACETKVVGGGDKPAVVAEVLAMVIA